MATTKFSPTQTLLNPAPNSTLFANAVAISGTHTLVSSVGGEEGESGNAKVYLFDTLTGKTLQTYLNPSAKSGDMYGNSIDISEKTVLIGAPRHNDKGEVYLYDKLSGQLLQTFSKPNASGGDYFGYSVAMSGNYVLIGTPYDDRGESNSGRAYLYNATTGELLRTFDNPTPKGGDLFAFSVAISGDTVVIGAFLDDTGAADTGSVYVFNAKTGELVHTILNPQAEEADLFGSAVAIYGDKIVVGARADDLGAVDAGSAYLFDAVTGKLLQTFANPTPESGDKFGVSVSIADNKVLIGASGDNTGADNSGSAYLFDAITGNLLETLTNPDIGNGDLFANSVDIQDGDALVIGAIGHDGIKPNIGAAYVFETANHKYYVSANENGTINGISYSDEDILVYDSKQGSWSVFFDGSQVGLDGRGVDIDAFSVQDDGSILISLDKSGVVLGDLIVDNSDIIRFKPATPSDNSAGTYELFLDGSTVGLEDSERENIDAITFTAKGDLVISVNGNLNAGGVIAKDEDLLKLNSISKTWELYFVGAQIGLDTNTDEDVDSAWIDDSGEIFLSTRRNAVLGIGDTSLTGSGSSIFKVALNSDNTISGISAFWDAASAGLPSGVDGFQLVS
ncbi:PQQ-binding-like beta-propeller repeat protein [Calothrix sp. FACHB-1219]|uniref:WD40 repeat domain-containing protein n=1 Tax=unclassified Calothrix TaxID=2619626 RepID=UPI001686C5CD|nr:MULTISPECIES: PQQ-binding-like beta-propeller repeat protein [unclassified Calothrix]MBD2201961.1 PQQ-binding-like beta-propeller repeat protein [Calothrix sp. FACHB-168]MBD2216997.1 PQQ-binding-like beta-propeller repeat protein [Calothrix sp. FACHB-1219]